MERATDDHTTGTSAEVVDFDEAFLAACPIDLRDELLAEAQMLADALPARGRARQVEALADSLSGDEHQSGAARLRARRLAAALRQLAREAEV